jgi:hypothetical protein
VQHDDISFVFIKKHDDPSAILLDQRFMLLSYMLVHRDSVRQRAQDAFFAPGGRPKRPQKSPAPQLPLPLRRQAENHRRPFDRLRTGTEEPAVIERILTHLGLCAQPPRAPARRVDLFKAA